MCSWKPTPLIQAEGRAWGIDGCGGCRVSGGGRGGGDGCGLDDGDFGSGRIELEEIRPLETFLFESQF